MTREVWKSMAIYMYTDNGGTGLGLKYALIVAAIVSNTESFNNC